MDDSSRGFGMTSDDVSLTKSIMKMLGGNPMEDELERRASVLIDSAYESVYELSRQRGLTLREWVMDDPRAAVRTAENSLAE